MILYHAQPWRAVVSDDEILLTPQNMSPYSSHCSTTDTRRALSTDEIEIRRFEIEAKRNRERADAEKAAVSDFWKKNTADAFRLPPDR